MIQSTSSAIASVLYATRIRHAETRSGSFIYNGDAMSFYEWEFRTRLLAHGRKEDSYLNAVNKVIDGLRGDAFVVAREVGLSILCEQGTDYTPSGIDELVAAMRRTIFPHTTHAAKELFRQFCLSLIHI